MYWALLADPGSDDEKGFTPEELDAMGAGAGRALYDRCAPPPSAA